MKLLLTVALVLAAALAMACAAEAATPSLAARQPQFLQVTPAPSDTKPWYSTDNLSVAAGLSYRWLNGGDARFLTPRKEFVFGLYNAWQLTEHVDAILNTEFGADTKATGFTIGLRGVLKLPK